MSSATLAVTNPRKFVASTYQQAFFDWIEKGSGSAILKAVAGSGKSTSIVRALPYINRTATVLILAFNSPIAKEMKAKIEALGAELDRAFANVEAATFHARGYRALLKRWGRNVAKPDVDGGKVRKILKDRLSEAEYEMYGEFVDKLVGFAKGVGVGIPGLAADEYKVWEAIIASQEMWLDDADATEERAIDIARKALRASNAKAEKERWIDFNDQLYLPLLWNLSMFKHDWVLVDEAQDTNPVRREFAKRSLKPAAQGGRLVAVGDPCQPAGTIVTMADGSEKTIEALKIGDHVRTFSKTDAAFVQSGRRVLGITEKPYAGKMVVVESCGKTTRYTENHYCYARMTDLAGKWCVYVMRKGNRWRVGTTKVQHPTGMVGVQQRKRVERAEDVWILTTFDTERAAKTYEFKVATEYGVPELLFHSPGKIGTPAWRRFQDAIDMAWDSLDKTKLNTGATKLLLDHDRCPDYPFNELLGTGIACVTRPMRIRAANLMDGMRVLHYTGKSHYTKDMFQPMTARRERFTGSVWSLNVDKEHSYIADGIATFNCQSIYAFTGASTDAMDQIAEEFGTIELPLTVSYRCPKAALAEVQHIVPYFEVHENAIEGVVKTLKAKEALALVGPEDAILCRKTAPLVSLAFQLIAEGRGCRVVGRDIGGGLVSLIKKLRPKGVDSLLERLDAYFDKEQEKFAKAGEEAKAEALADRIACIRTVVDSTPEAERTVPKVIERIDGLFADGDAKVLSLMTGHKAKGREFKRVIIWQPELLPIKSAKSDEAYQQEMNLSYVMRSRFTEEMYLVPAEVRP